MTSDDCMLCLCSVVAAATVHAVALHSGAGFLPARDRFKDAAYLFLFAVCVDALHICPALDGTCTPVACAVAVACAACALVDACAPSVTLPNLFHLLAI